MSLLSLPIDHKRTEPLPAPDAARSLLLHRATELTHEYTDEESTLPALWSPFSVFWDHCHINKKVMRRHNKKMNNLQQKQNIASSISVSRWEKKPYMENLRKTFFPQT